jgi:hypothetical protein
MQLYHNQDKNKTMELIWLSPGSLNGISANATSTDVG